MQSQGNDTDGRTSTANRKNHRIIKGFRYRLLIRSMSA